MYSIYCHVFPNGKRYVGLTKDEPEKRWNNGKGYNSCPLVNRAIKKYGWNNVKHEILATTDSKSEAEYLEKAYIAEFQTLNPSFGYNILSGGDVSNNCADEEMRKKLGNGWRGKNRSEEDKAKIADGVRKRFERPESNGHFGMKHSEETKNKMSESHKKQYADNPQMRVVARERMIKRMEDPEYRKKILDNLHKNPRKSFKMPEEAKKKLSEYNKGKWLGENSPTSIPVLQYTKDGEFVKRWANAGEAQRAGIANRSSIGNCCRNKPHYHTAGGFVWKFESN